MTTHNVLIAGHALAAVICFVAGCTMVARLPAGPHSARFMTFAIAAVTAVAALIAVILTDWSGLPTAKRLTFTGLALLACYLLVRTYGAARTLAARPPHWPVGFLAHLGFVLISLFDGFAIVSAIDLRLPTVAVALSAVIGVAVGVLAIRTATRREQQTITAEGRS
jgi:hypothetical protein